MKNKLKLVLWGKNFQLPTDYDKLKFDKYELKDINGYALKGKELRIYKNNELIKRILYYDNGNVWYEKNYKNGRLDGRQFYWNSYGGYLIFEENYKNGKKIKYIDYEK